jgi:hypothetical protein
VEVRDHLQRQQGVRAVQARSGTGGVLVHYDPAETSIDHLLDVLHDIGVVVAGLTAEEDLGDLGETLSESGSSHTANSIMSAVDDLDRRLSTATAQRLDLKVLFPLGLGALGVRQLVRSGLGLEQVPAFILLWYAFDAFYKLHRRAGASSESVE